MRVFDPVQRVDDAIVVINEEIPVKVHDFAHQVAMRTIELLEEKQHYKVSEEHRKEILKLVRGEVDLLLDRSS